MDKALQIILTKMKECSETIGAEMHIEADDLLIETIRILADTKPEQETVDKIITAFNKLNKLYG